MYTLTLKVFLYASYILLTILIKVFELTPKISIVIPNRNSPVIHRVCSALLQQDYPLSAVEIFIIGVDFPQLIPDHPAFTFIHTSETATAGFNRNVGLREATGELILFLDSDCIPAPDWLQTHIQYQLAGHPVVGGAVTFAAESAWQTADNVSAFHDVLPYTPGGERPYLFAANFSIQRAVLYTIGSFRSELYRAEDLEFSARLRQHGYPLFFTPQALVFHDPPRHTFDTVWQHWVTDAPDTVRIRLEASEILNTPRLAQFRFLYLAAAPLIALWATLRTFNNLQTIRYYLKTLPIVYLTKIAWCWGAFRHFPQTKTLTHA